MVSVFCMVLKHSIWMNKTVPMLKTCRRDWQKVHADGPFSLARLSRHVLGRPLKSCTNPNPTVITVHVSIAARSSSHADHIPALNLCGRLCCVCSVVCAVVQSVFSDTLHLGTLNSGSVQIVFMHIRNVQETWRSKMETLNFQDQDEPFISFKLETETRLRHKKKFWDCIKTKTF